MPAFNGTGPLGRGPMTGRGRGYCVVPVPEPFRETTSLARLEGMVQGIIERLDKLERKSVEQK